MIDIGLPYRLTPVLNTQTPSVYLSRMSLIYKMRRLAQIRREEGVFSMGTSIMDYLINHNPFRISSVSIPIPILFKIISYRLKYGFDYDQAAHLATNPENPIMKNLFELVDEDDIVFDIGAGRGDYSLKLAQLPNSPKEIIAFEPGDRSSKIVRLASKYDSKIRLIKSAVGTKDQEKEFYRTVDNGVVSLIGKTNAKADVNPDLGSVVDSSDINELGLPQPTVIKIDVNGWELDVLNVLENYLKKDDCRLIYIEIEPPSVDTEHRHPPIYELSTREIEMYFEENWSFDDILRILTRSGFKCEYLMDSSGDLFVKGAKDESLLKC